MPVRPPPFSGPLVNAAWLIDPASTGEMDGKDGDHALLAAGSVPAGPVDEPGPAPVMPEMKSGSALPGDVAPSPRPAHANPAARYADVTSTFDPELSGHIEFKHARYDAFVFGAGAWQPVHNVKIVDTYVLGVAGSYSIQMFLSPHSPHGDLVLANASTQRVMVLKFARVKNEPRGLHVFKGVEAFSGWVVVHDQATGRGYVQRPLTGNQCDESTVLAAVFDHFEKANAGRPYPRELVRRCMKTQAEIRTRMAAAGFGMVQDGGPVLTPDETEMITGLFSGGMELDWANARPSAPVKPVVPVAEGHKVYSLQVTAEKREMTHDEKGYELYLTLYDKIQLALRSLENGAADVLLLFRHRGFGLPLEGFYPVRHADPDLLIFAGQDELAGFFLAIHLESGGIFLRCPQDAPTAAGQSLISVMSIAKKLADRASVPENLSAICVAESALLQRLRSGVQAKVPREMTDTMSGSVASVRLAFDDSWANRSFHQLNADAVFLPVKDPHPPGKKSPQTTSQKKYYAAADGMMLELIYYVSDLGILYPLHFVLSRHELMRENWRLMPLEQDLRWVIVPARAASGKVQALVGEFDPNKGLNELPVKWRVATVDVSSYPVVELTRISTGVRQVTYANDEHRLVAQLAVHEGADGISGWLAGVSPGNAAYRILHGRVQMQPIKNGDWVLGGVGLLQGVRSDDVRHEGTPATIRMRLPRQLPSAFEFYDGDIVVIDGDMQPEASESAVQGVPTEQAIRVAQVDSPLFFTFSGVQSFLPNHRVLAFRIRFSGKGTKVKPDDIEILDGDGKIVTAADARYHEELVDSQDAFSALRCRFSFRLGNIRYAYHFALFVDSFATRSVSPLHQIIWYEISRYAERYEAFDRRDELRSTLRDVSAQEEYRAPLLWRSAPRADPREWIEVNASDAPGTRIILRLGRNGQGKLKLQEGAQVFLRVVNDGLAAPHEFIYLWRAGRLESWKGQAPAGDVRLMVTNEQLELQFVSGVLAEALVGAYPPLTMPKWELVFDEHGVLSAVIWDGRNLDLSDVKKRRFDGLKEHLLELWQGQIRERRSAPGFGRIGIDFIPEPIEATPRADVREMPRKTETPPAAPVLSKRERLALEKEARRLAREQRELEEAARVATERERVDEEALHLLQERQASPKVAPHTSPPSPFYLSADECLPRIEFSGDASQPTALILHASPADGLPVLRCSSDIQVSDLGPDAVFITAIFGSEWHEYRVNFSRTPGVIERVDVAWPAERAQIVQERDRQRLKSERLWVWDDGGQALCLLDGLGEAVTADTGPVRLSGRMILNEIYVVPGDSVRELLRGLGVQVTGNIWHVVSLDPLRVECSQTLAPEVVPLTQGMRVPLEDLSILYGETPSYQQVNASTEVVPRKNLDSWMENLQLDPVLVPAGYALAALYGSDTPVASTRPVPFSFVHSSGTALQLRIVRKARGWTISDEVKPTFSRPGERPHIVYHPHISTIGPETSLREYDSTGRLLMDLRLFSFHGIPVVYNARAVMGARDHEDFLDRLIFVSAAALHVSRAETGGRYLAAESAQNHYVFRRSTGDVVFRPQLDDGHWVVGSEDLESTWQRLYDTRTRRIYLYTGPMMRPTEAFELVWMRGRPPALVPVGVSDWQNLRHGAVQDRLFEHLRSIEARLMQAHPEKAYRAKAQTEPAAAMWQEPAAELPASERVPFLFHLQIPDADTAHDPTETICQRLKNQIFLPSAASQEDMVYGHPEIGKRRAFDFIGNRGDVMTIVMTFTWYENQHRQKSLGWLIFPQPHAEDAEIDVRVNGERAAHVTYDRVGGAQAVRFGALSTQVELRYFSWSLEGGSAAFGFREGEASTTRNGGRNYEEARRRLEKLLQVSGVWNGRYDVESTTANAANSSDDWTLKNFRLIRRGRSGRSEVELSYFVSLSAPVSASLGTGDDGKPLSRVTLRLDGTDTEFQVYGIAGTQTLYLREILPDGSRAIPRRLILALAPDGSPRLREFAPDDLDLTQAYLDGDVWPDEFLPVVKMGIHRGPLTIYNTRRVREWNALLFPDDDLTRHRGTPGLLKWARQYAVGDPQWGGRLARLIVNDAETFAALGWSAGSLATRRQAVEFFNAALDFKSGSSGRREQYFMPADLEADAFFDGMGAVRVFGFLGMMGSRGTSGMEITRAGVPVVRRDALQDVMQIATQHLAYWQRTHATLDNRRFRSLDAALGPDDDRNLHDKVADGGADLDEISSGRDMARKALGRLDALNSQVMRRFLSGANISEIARELNLPLEDIAAIIDAFEDLLADEMADID